MEINFKKAKRMKYFKIPIYNEIMERNTKDLIDFSLGSPDIPPNSKVIETIKTQVEDEKNYRYSIRAIPKLLEAIKEWYKKRYNVDLETNEIALLQGSQEALVNLPLIFCDPGDAVLIPNPYYPIYEQAPRLAQAEVKFMPLKKENNFLPDLDKISEVDLKNAKLIYVSYPNNPTAVCANEEFYLKLINFAKSHNLIVIHDNAYSDLVFDEKPQKSFLSFPGAKDIGIELNTFSKSYGMAGARLGVLVGNKKIVEAYHELKSNLDYGVFFPIQYGGITALKEGGDQIEKTRLAYKKRRDLVIEHFGKAGWIIPKCEATMFLWAPIPKKMDSEKFAELLLDKTGIVVTPGTDFGSEGEGYVRIALIQNEDKIIEASNRLLKIKEIFE